MEHSQSRLSILVVDDCQYTRETMSHIIAMHFSAATVFMAGNGKIGLDLFKEHMPDIVITDINMPEMDGIQMATEIKLLRSNTHFIVVTANNGNELHGKFSKIGHADFMIKPIGFERLFATIGKCITELALESLSFTGVNRVLSHSKETSVSPLRQVA